VIVLLGLITVARLGLGELMTAGPRCAPALHRWAHAEFKRLLGDHPEPPPRTARGRAQRRRRPGQAGRNGS